MTEIGFLRKEGGFSLRDTVRSSAVREGLKGRPRTETLGWPGNAPVFPGQTGGGGWGKREVSASFLGLLPPRPVPRKSER